PRGRQPHTKISAGADITSHFYVSTGRPHRLTDLIGPDTHALRTLRAMERLEQLRAHELRIHPGAGISDFDTDNLSIASDVDFHRSVSGGRILRVPNRVCDSHRELVSIDGHAHARRRGT